MVYAVMLWHAFLIKYTEFPLHSPAELQVECLLLCRWHTKGACFHQVNRKSLTSSTQRAFAKQLHTFLALNSHCCELDKTWGFCLFVPHRHLYGTTKYQEDGSYLGHKSSNESPCIIHKYQKWDKTGRTESPHNVLKLHFALVGSD